MKAIKYSKYGGPEVMQLVKTKRPLPGDNELMIRVHAAAVNAGDVHLLKGRPMMVRLVAGLLKPKHQILGTDVSGVVEQVGKNVTHFSPGDEVYGDLSGTGFGGFSEYVSTHEKAISIKPSNVSWEASAAVPTSAVTALQALRDHGKIKMGDQVMIVGASGGVGSFAVKLAKIFGAEVTAVCSTGKVGKVSAMGADHVIDYRKQQLIKVEEKFDIIYAANGNESLRTYKRLLKSGGRLIVSGGKGTQFLRASLFGPLLSLIGNKQLKGMMMKPNQQDLFFLRNLMEEGVLVPTIDKVLSLEEVPQALSYLENGSTTGKVVIKL